jgi:formylglycine-generating enzyme required for sulfatase activity
MESKHRWGIWLLFLAPPLWLGCGEERSPKSQPAWAAVSAEQIAEATRSGLPVAIENRWGMRFVLVPRGAYLRGSPDAERGRGHDELQHHAEISAPFYLQIGEVTNGQYRRFRETHRSGSYDDIDGQCSLDGDEQPVVLVSWDDARAFAAWLTRSDPPRIYLIPTEAQWEYAARAGSTTRYFCGDTEEELCHFANFSDRNVPGTVYRDVDDGQSVSASAGAYPPNGWGLYNTLGNVWEWVEDWYGEYPSGSVRDPRGPRRGTFRVMRGGSWRSAPRGLRSAQRGSGAPTNRHSQIGFRVAIAASP